MNNIVAESLRSLSGYLQQENQVLRGDIERKDKEGKYNRSLQNAIANFGKLGADSTYEDVRASFYQSLMAAETPEAIAPITNLMGMESSYIDKVRQFKSDRAYIDSLNALGANVPKDITPDHAKSLVDINKSMYGSINETEKNASEEKSYIQPVRNNFFTGVITKVGDRVQTAYSDTAGIRAAELKDKKNLTSYNAAVQLETFKKQEEFRKSLEEEKIKPSGSFTNEGQEIVLIGKSGIRHVPDGTVNDKGLPNYKPWTQEMGSVSWNPNDQGVNLKMMDAYNKILNEKARDVFDFFERTGTYKQFADDLRGFNSPTIKGATFKHESLSKLINEYRKDKKGASLIARMEKYLQGIGEKDEDGISIELKNFRTKLYSFNSDEDQYKVAKQRIDKLNQGTNTTIDPIKYPNIYKYQGNDEVKKLLSLPNANYSEIEQFLNETYKDR
jgi:hypothetical protein